MKNLTKTKTFLVVCSMLALFSCKKNIESVDSATTNNDRYSKTVKGDTIIHKITMKDGYTNTVLEIKDRFYIADDIIIDRDQFNAFKSQTLLNTSTTARGVVTIDTLTKLWPEGKVYYRLPVVGEKNGGASPLTSEERQVFLDTLNKAMLEISAAAPGIQFIEDDTKVAYIKFVKSDGNNAWLGYGVGARQVNLFGYAKRTTVMHEIMHALGIAHEHNRSDRGTYINVDTTRVDPRYQNAFNIFTEGIGYANFGDFDFKSVMFYAVDLGLKKGAGPAISVTPAYAGTTLLKYWDKKHLSDGDRATLSRLYPHLKGSYNMKSTISPSQFLYTGSISYPYLTATNDGSGQNYKYVFVSNNDGTYQIKPFLYQDKAFTYNPSYASIKIVLEQASSSLESQKFIFTRVDTNGRYTISPFSDPTKKLEFYGWGINVKAESNDPQIIQLVKQ